MPLLVNLRVPASRAALEAATTGLVALNRFILSRTQLPALFDAGVRYKAETSRPEHWRTADQIFGKGYGDCEDLAAWRAAELQLRGEAARVVVYRTGPKRFHAVVRRGDGSIEDPSKILKR